MHIMHVHAQSLSHSMNTMRAAAFSADTYMRVCLYMHIMFYYTNTVYMHILCIWKCKKYICHDHKITTSVT